MLFITFGIVRHAGQHLRSDSLRHRDLHIPQDSAHAHFKHVQATEFHQRIFSSVGVPSDNQIVQRGAESSVINSSGDKTPEFKEDFIDRSFARAAASDVDAQINAARRHAATTRQSIAFESMAVTSEPLPAKK
jgi:hypothetical protein